MRIEQRQRRAANQLPAAGRHQRIDAGLAAADADGAGRHRQTRLSAARRRQLFRHAAQIGETRLKAEEIDHVGRRRVAFHHLPRRHAGMARHFIQIGALLPAVDHRNIHGAIPASGSLCFPNLAAAARASLRRRPAAYAATASGYSSPAPLPARRGGDSAFRQRPDALLARQGHRRRQFKHYRSFTQQVITCLLHPYSPYYYRDEKHTSYA